MPNASTTNPTPTPRAAAPAGRLARFRRTRLWRWGRWPFYAGLAGGALVVAMFAWLFATVDLPADPPSLASSVILDAKGNELAILSHNDLRVPVSIDRMSPVIPKALIAAEDRSFYDHQGVNPAGIARAVYQNLRSDNLQGGSTITQQLVKNEFLSSERTWKRKLSESVLAVKLERRSDKQDILERYLNTVYFGRGTYGIEAGSRVYFDKSAAELTTGQAAFLIGMLPGPSGADPVTNPVKAKQRRDNVLNSMVATGDLTPAEAEAAKADPLNAKPPARPITLTAGVAPHFVEWVRSELIADYGEDMVYGGGLRVKTTLDLDDQRAAEAAIAAELTDPAGPQAALVGVDKGGAVRAFVGGRDFSTYQVDLARGTAGGGSGRAPGSTFKPFALAASLEKRVPLDRKRPAPARMTLATPGPWTVSNYGGEAFRGPLDEIEATVHSVNTVYAQMSLEVGAPAIVDMAHRAGVTSELDANPAIVLGTDSVSPLEMAGAYLTFARDGSRVAPYTIVEIHDLNGTELRSHFHVEQPAMPAGVAEAVNTALQPVVERGTGTAAKLDRPMAGKTGTTEGNGDAWFAGYTPEYAAVVWMGYPEGPERKMNGITGGSKPAKIWKGFAATALADIPPTPFAPAPDEYLHGRQVPMTLAVDNVTVAPGAAVRVSGTGYADCFDDFHVEVTATKTNRDLPLPPAQRSDTDTGSDDDQRRADVILPADAPEGAWKAVADRDGDGDGPKPVAEATFTVDDGRPDPTTTTSTIPPVTSPPDSTRSTTTVRSGPSSSASTATTTTAPAPSTTTTNKRP